MTSSREAASLPSVCVKARALHARHIAAIQRNLITHAPLDRARIIPQAIRVHRSTIAAACSAPYPSAMLRCTFVSAAPQFATAVYGLAAVLAWGTSDFLGG